MKNGQVENDLHAYVHVHVHIKVCVHMYIYIQLYIPLPFGPHDTHELVFDINWPEEGQLLWYVPLHEHI